MDHPHTGFRHWMETRLPFVAQFRREFALFPMPRNLTCLWSFGALLTVVLGLMVLSGIFLAMNYTPDISRAFASIETIDRRIPSGWFIRSLHTGGVTMLFLALYLHIGRGLWYGSYKAPRELVWLSGLGLLAMFILTAFAGYILPWGQMSYWGGTVVVNAINAIPGLGHPLVTFLLGEDGLGDIALHRFFVLHFVLAFGALGVVALHVATLHAVGPSHPPLKEAKGASPGTVPFHPFYTAKDGVALGVFLIVYALLIFFLPSFLTEADNYRPANPLRTPADITPEWYLAPFYAILRAVPSRLGGLVLVVASLAVLFALPWLDRSPWSSAGPRPVRKLALILAFLSFVALIVAGTQPASAGWLLLSRGALAGWLGYFLVFVPLFSRREITLLQEKPSS